MASEVRLMGDFDGWTVGHLLSCDAVEDSAFTRFEAIVKLVPGRYRVKFQVDGEWRLAPEWPVEESASGDANNIIVVENQLVD